MKNFIISVVFCLLMNGFAFAQPVLPELDKIKQIKLLESTRDDVKRLFAEYREDFDDEEEGVEVDSIWTEHMTIRFHYSLGDCSDDDDQEWNVSKGTVTEINVILKETIKAKDLKIDLSKLERIKEIEDDDEQDPDDFVYYDQAKNVSYGLSDGEIENIKFTPAEKNFPALCANETMREFSSNKEWLSEKLKDRPSNTIGGCGFANVDEVRLSRNEVTATTSCGIGAKEPAACGDDAEISVEAKGTSSDPNDVLMFDYTISGGKIIGTGDKVIWSLIGVKPGRYTITVSVDAGGGARGTTKTEEVIVKECPECPSK